ncbi:MAG TPA: metallophosphoesterase [Beijerinckiaceae bacterium]|nr:metallophosphoesterase [Beijerinckiaceae bacterium]
MRRLAHISDLHFGRVDEAAVEGLIDELNAERPDLVVASGDFTMRARNSEFVAARAFLDRLKSPWLGVPGNHDITPYHLIQRFFDPFRRYRLHIHPDIEPVWIDEQVAVIGLNTARRWAPEFNWSHGRIGREQIARTEALLRGLPRHLFKVIVAHHPFLPPPWDEDARIVGRAKEALAAFERLGVGLALAGHLHRGYSRFVEPIIRHDTVAGAVTKPPEETTSRRLLVVQAGSATSTRLRNEPNAYNHITIEEGRATVEARVWTGTGWACAAEAVRAGSLPDHGAWARAEPA